MKILILTIALLLACVGLSINSVYAQTWQVTYQKADSLMEKDNYEQAIFLYRQVLPQIEKDSTQMNPFYLKVRSRLAWCMIFSSKKDSTELFLLENLYLCHKFGAESEQYARALHNIGLFYIPYLTGNEPKKAEKYLLEAIALRKKIWGEKHQDYATSLGVLAILYKEIGNYEAAEPLYLKNLQIKKETLGEKHIDYATSLNNLAILYRELGNYEQAINFYTKAIEIVREVKGKENTDYALFANNLAGVYMSLGNYVAADSLYKQSLQIREKIVGKNHTNYAQSLENLGLLYVEKNNYALAQSYFLQAEKIYKENLGEKHYRYAHLLSNLANLYEYMNKYATAESLYLQTLAIKKELFSEKHFSCASSSNNLALLYQTQNQYPKALTYYLQTVQNSQDLITQNFSFLSETEKSKYFNEEIKAYFDNFYAFAVQNKLNAQLYDLQLFTKGILLNSVQKMKNRILNSKDSFLIQEYESWNNLKISLVKYDQMSKEELQEIALNIDSLENLVNEKEKALSLKSESFAKITDKKQITWKDIQAKLKKDEAAVEIVRVNKFGVQKMLTDTTDHEYYRNTISLRNGISKGEFPKYPLYGLTDTIYYAALIVKPDSKAPELVLLENGNDLENKYFKMYRNMARYQIQDKNSYQQYWQAIREKLGKVKKVYFSPDGIYNQINLYSIKIGI